MYIFDASDRYLYLMTLTSFLITSLCYCSRHGHSLTVEPDKGALVVIFKWKCPAFRTLGEYDTAPDVPVPFDVTFVLREDCITTRGSGGFGVDMRHRDITRYTP